MLNLGQPRTNRVEAIPAIWKTPFETYEKSKNIASSSSNTVNEENDKSDQNHQQSSSSSISPADLVNIRGIKIANWRIETHRGSIADSKTIDELSDRWGIPLPEMPFDKNKVLIRYEGENGSSKNSWQYSFDGFSALRSVEGVSKSSSLTGLKLNESKAGTSKIGEEAPKKKRVQVSYANEWGKKREQQQQQQQQQQGIQIKSDEQNGGNKSNFGPEVAMAAATNSIATARDYDWTYSSTWPGGIESESTTKTFQPGKDPNRDRIPIERLGPPSTPSAKAEPILFFDDLILFEDELGDNGTSLLNVKVRVMPTGILILQRFFLRVDHVVFRIFDTRMYVSFYDDETISAHSLSNPTAEFSKLSLNQTNNSTSKPSLASPFRIIRECNGYQERYSDVRSRLPPYMPNDLSPLTDVGWVAQQLTKMDENRQRALFKADPARFGFHPGTTVPRDQHDPTQPAVLPSMNMHGQESNRILGEVIDGKEQGDDLWEGQGHRVDIILLH